MKLLQQYLSVPLLISLLLLPFAGCNVTNTNPSGQSPVAVKMKVQSTAMPKQISGAPTTQAVDSLTEVKFLVKKLELKSSAEEDSMDFEVHDFVADLPLDGSNYDITSKQVPKGSYDEFKLKIDTPEDGSAVQDSSFYNNSGSEEHDGYSIVINGIYNGNQFTYRTGEDFELEMALNPPLAVTDTTASASVAINVDPSSWFKDSSGNALDPTNPDNREKIDENIRHSFHAEHEEHGEHEDHENNDAGNGDSENGDG